MIQTACTAAADFVTKKNCVPSAPLALRELTKLVAALWPDRL